MGYVDEYRAGFDPAVVDARCTGCSWRAWDGVGDSSFAAKAAEAHAFDTGHTVERVGRPGWVPASLPHGQGETVVMVDPNTGGRKGQKLGQFSQIPPDVLLELAEHFGKGVAKYPDSESGEPNWQRGYSWRLSVDALGRHLLAFLAGEDIDPETGSSHLIAVVWHAMVLRWFQLHGKGTDYRGAA